MAPLPLSSPPHPPTPIIHHFFISRPASLEEYSTRSPTISLSSRDNGCRGPCSKHKTTFTLVGLFLGLLVLGIIVYSYARYRTKREKKQPRATGTQQLEDGGSPAYVGVQVTRGENVELDERGEAPPSYGEAVKAGEEGKGVKKPDPAVAR